MGKGKKSRGDDTDDKDGPTIENILELGGVKDDYALIDAIDDDDEDIVMEEADELDAEPINKDDIKEFIEQLSIRQYRDPSFRKTPKNEQNSTEPVKSSKIIPANKVDSIEKKKKGNKFKIQHDEVSSTVVSSDTPSKCPTPHQQSTMMDLSLADYKPRKYLLMKTGVNWIDQSFPDDPCACEPISDHHVTMCRLYAQRLYQDDVDTYTDRKKSGKSDSSWMKTVVSSGTLGDKVAALTLMIQDANIHTLSQLDVLIGMVKKKGKRECFMALDNLKELFLTMWLPDDMKLRKFEEHPLGALTDLSSGNKDSRDRRLIIWYYEDLIKQKYEEFVASVEVLAQDQLATAKTKAIGTVFELLVAKPEQEKRLLTILVNKLGDPDHKIAAKCTHLLQQLLDKHPNMKLVVTMEVERLLYRTNIAKKAQYYGICFLNQMMLNHDEQHLASRLISAYFSFFKSYVNKGEVDSKMMSSLLTGVNRAFPYAKDDRAQLEDNMNTLYQVVHVVNFNTSIQALMLIYQVIDSSTTVSDRYYSSLYRKMLDPELGHSSKQAMFLNLIFKTMKKDNSKKRVKAFLKRISQVCGLQSPTFACSTLILVAEVLKSHPSLLNLTQVAEESDDEEHFVDAADDDDGVIKPNNSNNKDGGITSASWIHRSNIQDHHDSVHYDPLGRNPLYTCVDHECIWEMKKLSSHYHPTVALFARNILEGRPIQYPGDPLQDFMLIRFLDRFVYRNPKKGQENKAAHVGKHHGLPVGARAHAVNTEQYLLQGEAKIPVDERFFYKYFRRRADLTNRVGDVASDVDSDAESVDDDEFDGFIAGRDDVEGDEKIDFDFAGEFNKNKTKSKKTKTDHESSDEDSDGDLSAEEIDLGDMSDIESGAEDSATDAEDEDGDFEAGEDFGENDDDDINEEDIEFSEDDGDIFSHNAKSSASGKSKRKLPASVTRGAASSANKRGKKDDMSSLFASADQFSHLIEEGSSSGGKMDMAGSHALSNVKDKASVKQLNWEMERDRWLRDADWKSNKRPSGRRSGQNSRRPQNRQGQGRKKKR